MARRRRRISSSLLPENMGPQITSIQPRLPVTKSISGDAYTAAGTLFADHVGVLNWLRLTLDCDGGDWIVWGDSGQTADSGSEAILVDLDHFAAGMKPRGFHLSFQTADGDVIARPIVNVHVECVSLAREQGVVGALHLARLGGVDSVAVLLHPFADGGEDPDRILGDGAVRFRADVQQVIAAIARASD